MRRSFFSLFSRNLIPCGCPSRRVNFSSTTHFGNQTVKTEEKQAKVAHVFHEVAQRYDIMNDFMSAGIHRLWKDNMVDMISPLGPSPRILDVAGGTGDIAFRFAELLTTTTQNDTSSPSLSSSKGGEITVFDINSSMLAVGRDRARAKGFDPETLPPGLSKLEWVEGNAESLPFSSDSFDLYTIAFGIRNVTHVDRALAEAYRVLRPGARFVCLEFSQVENKVLSSLYDAFSFNVIPALGELIAKDRDSYQYLVESIRKFPPQEEFKTMLQTAGFTSVHVTNFTGGVAAVHSGFKPL